MREDFAPNQDQLADGSWRGGSAAGAGNRFDRALVRLAQQPIPDVADSFALETLLRPLCQEIASTLRVDRVGVWQFGNGEHSLECIALWDSENRRGTTVGQKIDSRDLPRYFAALQQSRHIAAGDALHDPRTRDLAPRYLEPLGIAAMLDSPIRVDGEVFGVLCAESRVGPREWLDEEEHFASAAADLVAITLQTSAVRRSESRYRALFDCSPIPAFHLDEDGMILLTNTASREFDQAESFVGLEFVSLLHRDDQPRIQAELDGLLMSEAGCFTSVARLKGKHGDWQWCSLSVARLSHAAPEERSPELVLLAGNLMTRHSRESSHGRSMRSEAMNTTAARVAHDLLNILTIIEASGRSALDSMPGDSPARADLEPLLEEARRGCQLTRELLG
jgi:PAS domain S-box-containing protein